jgi:hypothetical protein
MKSKTAVLFMLLTGILFLFLNILIWIRGLIIDISHGMDAITAVPLLVAGVFLISAYYRSIGSSKPLKAQRWKFILTLFLINYLLLYIIYIIGELIFSVAIDFMSLPGIILPVLLSLFVIGFILSWRHEFYAGIFFLIWYSLTIYGQLQYHELLHRGPYILIGLSILVHGILYIVFHFKIKTKN